MILLSLFIFNSMISICSLFIDSIVPLIRSISGLRGTLGDGLTPHDVVRHVRAFAELTQYGPIVVGRDGRPSGNWIEQIVTGTLTACAY